MVLFKENLLKFDFFGSQFQFSIMGNNKYKSLVGLIISCCCLIMNLIVTILFGRDFYYKENPKIITESIKTEDNNEFNLSPSNLTLAFRIENDYDNRDTLINSLIKTIIVTKDIFIMKQVRNLITLDII